MDKMILQVPVSKILKKQAEEQVKLQGFSSLQEYLRVIMTETAQKRLGIRVEREQFPPVHLSPKNERRYAQMEKDFEEERNIRTAHSAEEFLRQLHDDSKT